jgi:xylose dehydrogenase (NAD/NADP)
VNWGLLSTAHINRRVIPAMRAARRSVVSAVASRDAARAESYAREWEIPRWHASYDALLHDSGIDAVYIPLPNALHVEWTLRAVDAGKHVLCEKPLALAADDIDRIASVARARDRVVAEAFVYRHEPQTQRLLELLRGGAIGPVRTISSGFSYQQSRAADVRLDAALGGGSLWDVGCYAVGIARLAASAEPTEVFGWSSTTTSGVDEEANGLMRFADGVVASIHSSFRAAYRTWLEIGGRDGAIHVPNPFRPAPLEAIELRRGDDVTRLEVQGSPLLFVRMIEDFIVSTLDGKPPVITLEESRGNAATLAALYESARTGLPVRLA